jgi:hypothetical protein
MVSEYVFDIATSGEEPPADIGEALRVAIGEVLSAATSEDWEQVGRDLLADAHDCIGDGPPPGAPPEEPIPAAWWPLPAGGSRRKTPVIIRQEAILDWLTEVRSATLREIAEHFGISKHTARMKSDGLVAQGKLEVRPGARANRDRPVIERRYTVPRPPDQAAEGVRGGHPVAREDGPHDRLELSAGSS